MIDTQAADPRRVLVGVDGSPSSIEAIRQGHRMAHLLGVPLAAVSAWHEHHGLFPPITYVPEQDTQRDLRISIREAFRGTEMPEIEMIVVKGDPADNLIRLSRNAEMLVLGSRGHSGMVGTVLGSVSGLCAAHAHCPVLVVHPVPIAGSSVPSQGSAAAGEEHGATGQRPLVAGASS